MKTLIEYRIVEGNNFPITLIDKIKSLTVEGWTLQGGVSITYVPGNGIIYAQALVRITTK